MKAVISIFIWALIFISPLAAQKKCTSHHYHQQRVKENPLLTENVNKVESFIRQQAADFGLSRMEEVTIRIPVVVHNLYHLPSEKITIEQVRSQMEVLNKCFRRRNVDTIRTPYYFRHLAADCNIEFYLATSDPYRRATNGIIRKYTPVKSWEADDKMKYSSKMGSDAWDPGSYLNIWVCNLNRVAGYASVPGDVPANDGIVLGLGAFGTIGSLPDYDMGKTAVHEIGHWLGLKHLWGDQYCGDDGVADTPRQAGYNIGCPNTINITCNNGPYGDMYMNYMDLTNDACMNLFTQGQKARMRSLFAPGGPRYSLLNSRGLMPPLINEIPLPDDDPRWLHPQLYPNPANHILNIDLAYDSRWIGKIVQIYNLQGQVVMAVPITSKIQSIDISLLQKGTYIIAAKRDDEESLKLKFVKLQ